MSERLQGPESVWHRDGAVVTWIYWWRHELYRNPHFNNAEWEAVDEKSVFAGFAPDAYGWFKWTDIYYDGHVVKALSLFGFVVGWGYTWDAQPVPVEPKYDPYGFDMDPFDIGEF